MLEHSQERTSECTQAGVAYSTRTRYSSKHTLSTCWHSLAKEDNLLLQTNSSCEDSAGYRETMNHLVLTFASFLPILLIRDGSQLWTLKRQSEFMDPLLKYSAEDFLTQCL